MSYGPSQGLIIYQLIMIYAAAYENQPITPTNCHIIEPSTMSHSDWQSWEVFMTIMVIIMSHNHIKLSHCFADGWLRALTRSGLRWRSTSSYAFELS